MCRFPASGSSRESFAHSGVAMTPSVTRLSRNALASSAIRCRFVDRFARPKVLTHVARQRFSPRDAPLSSPPPPPFLDRIPARPVPRRRQFYEGATTSHSRIPGHLFVSLPGPTQFLLGSCSPLPALPGGWRSATGQDLCSAGDLNLPAHLHVDASGTSQVPRRPILCLCPVPRPRPDRRSLTNNGRIRCCPCCHKSKGSSVSLISRLQRGFGTCCLRFKSGVATATCKTQAGWLAFAVRESSPLDRDERFPSPTSLPSGRRM